MYMDNKLTVKVAKDKLLTAMEANLDEHTKIIAEANRGWREKVVRAAEGLIRDMWRDFPDNEELSPEQRDAPCRLLAIPPPEDHRRDYAQAILMIGMHEGDTIELSAELFRRYVLDEWDWQSHAVAVNSVYSATAAAKMADMGVGRSGGRLNLNELG